MSDVTEKTNLPGTILAAYGGVSLALGLLGLVVNLASTGMQVASGAEIMVVVPSFVISLVVSIIGLTLSTLALLGGLRLRKGTSSGMVYAGAIASMVPCSICCVIGLPVGAFAIYTMQDDEVRAAMADA